LLLLDIIQQNLVTKCTFYCLTLCKIHAKTARIAEISTSHGVLIMFTL